MRPVRAISPNLRVRRSVMNRTVHSSVSFDVLIALAFASPSLSMVIARHVGTAFTVSRARRSKVSALMVLSRKKAAHARVSAPEGAHETATLDRRRSGSVGEAYAIRVQNGRVQNGRVQNGRV